MMFAGLERLPDAGQVGDLLGHVHVLAGIGSVRELVPDVGLALGPVLLDAGDHAVAHRTNRVAGIQADVDAHIGAPDGRVLIGEGVHITAANF